MLFGLGIPTCREGLAYPSGFASPRAMVELAREAEALGFDALWANDHLITQRVVMDSLSAPPNFYEPLTIFAYLAGHVERIKLMTSTLIAPLRDPVLLAKQAATLDQITGGRLILGLGIGAYREEFEALARHLATGNRGEMLEEFLAVVRLLFKERRAHFEGKYYRFPEIEVYPKPVQDPLPIYLSGNSPAAIRRAARIADGLIVAGVSPEQAREAVRQLRLAMVHAGRDPASAQVCVQAWISIADAESIARERLMASQHFQRLRALHPGAVPEMLVRSFEEQNLIGTPEAVCKRIEAYVASEVDHLGLIFLAPDIEHLVDAMRCFARHVLSRFHKQPG